MRGKSKRMVNRILLGKNRSSLDHKISGNSLAFFGVSIVDDKIINSRVENRRDLSTRNRIRFDDRSHLDTALPIFKISFAQNYDRNEEARIARSKRSAHFCATVQVDLLQMKTTRFDNDRT